MKDSTVFILAGAIALTMGEGLAVHLLVSDDSFTPGVADWLITTLVGGPAFAFLFTIPVAIVCVLIAMARFPR